MCPKQPIAKAAPASTTARVGAFALLGASACLTGCRSYPLHSLLTDDVLHARLSESFVAGMDYDDVNASLTELRVPSTYRYTYADAPPRDMLVRLFPPGGFWLDRDSQHIRWVDLTFEFDGSGSLTGLWTSRGGARYIDGWPITITPSPFIGSRRYYPAPPPPPVTPPREREVPLSGS